MKNGNAKINDTNLNCQFQTFDSSIILKRLVDLGIDERSLEYFYIHKFANNPYAIIHNNSIHSKYYLKLREKYKKFLEQFFFCIDNSYEFAYQYKNSNTNRKYMFDNYKDMKFYILKNDNGNMESEYTGITSNRYSITVRNLKNKKIAKFMFYTNQYGRCYDVEKFILFRFPKSLL